jgi:hypothetical protein
VLSYFRPGARLIILALVACVSGYVAGNSSLTRRFRHHRLVARRDAAGRAQTRLTCKLSVGSVTSTWTGRASACAPVCLPLSSRGRTPFSIRRASFRAAIRLGCRPGIPVASRNFFPNFFVPR